MKGREAVLVRYGELFLKSEPVMRHYVRVLTTNLKQALEGAGLDHAVHVFRGRVLVTGTDLEEIAIVARRIFGIVGVSLCTWTEADLEVIRETAVARAREHLFPGMTFAVRARRSGMEGFSSQELGAEIGGLILEAIPGLSVDLGDPDYEIFVEARDIGGIVYDGVAPGPGGVPLGTQARALSLLSSGIDSPVASWLMMRRGSIPT
ncbi:MAG: THUMP domain-containing protein, partial [Methanomicrobiaceae archaeon]|nr:THUMP domain-containing protein [Methanomicrobiaceae archaeon]